MAKISNTFYIILGTLNLGPKSGYDIKKRIERSTGEFWSINYGQIYPLLKTMVDEGYATLITDNEDSKHERKVYAITEKGVEALIAWLAEPINYNNPKGNELLVKLFFGKDIPVQENIRRLMEFRNVCMGYLENSNRVREDIENKMAGDDQYDYSMIAIRHGLMMIQMKLDWCDESIKRLKKHLTDASQQ